MCGGAHVKQGMFHLRILGFHIQAANQIRLVFLVRHPARGGARCAALAQRKDAGPLRPGGKKGVGVDADEQVGLDPSRLVDPHMQGHEEVGVACQIGAHGVAVDGGRIDAVAQPVRQTQHHVFFARTTGADGAGIFAAVAGVQRNDDQAVGPGCARAGAGGGEFRAFGRCCRFFGVLGDQLTQWIVPASNRLFRRIG